MTQPNQSDHCEDTNDMVVDNSYNQSELVNQPSTKITPVTDGVGGSESTNQSEHKEVK